MPLILTTQTEQAELGKVTGWLVGTELLRDLEACKLPRHEILFEGLSYEAPERNPPRRFTRQSPALLG